MECIIYNNELFKNVVLGYCNLMPELSFECDSDGIRGKGLSQDHTTFLSFDFKSSFFSDHHLDEPCTLTVDTTELSKVLARCKKDDTIIMGNDDYNLNLVFDTDDLKRTFKVRLVDQQYESPDLPNVDYAVNNTSIPFSLFNDWLKDISIYDNKVTFETVQNSLKLSGEGDFGDGLIEYTLLQEYDYSKASFGLDKLSYISKLNKVSKVLHLSMGTNAPLLITLTDMAEEVNCEFLLAPHLDKEDED